MKTDASFWQRYSGAAFRANAFFALKVWAILSAVAVFASFCFVRMEILSAVRAVGTTCEDSVGIVDSKNIFHCEPGQTLDTTRLHQGDRTNIMYRCWCPGHGLANALRGDAGVIASSPSASASPAASAPSEAEMRKLYAAEAEGLRKLRDEDCTRACDNLCTNFACPKESLGHRFQNGIGYCTDACRRHQTKWEPACAGFAESASEVKACGVEFEKKADSR